uniref:Uncharacterized protein n=1 Tax=Arundo donax TaxID=35708 RepID=A0A0A9CGW8_ARUDO
MLTMRGVRITERFSDNKCRLLISCQLML